MKKEAQLQKIICSWLKIQYPSIYFFSDPSGLFAGGAHAKKNWGMIHLLKDTRSKHSALDLVILYPNDEYHGLILELKSETPFKKDGTLKTREHYAEQQKTIDHLNDLGYKAVWCWEFEQAKVLIEKYMEE